MSFTTDGGDLWKIIRSLQALLSIADKAGEGTKCSLSIDYTPGDPDKLPQWFISTVYNYSYLFTDDKTEAQGC